MKKNNVSTIVLSLLACIVCTQATANTCEEAQAGTSYYFGNGVNSTLLQSAASTQVLGRALRAEGVFGPDDRLRLAYNRTDNLVADVIESLVQDLQTTFLDTWLAFFDGLPDTFLDGFNERVAQFNTNILDDADVGRHVQQYRSDILAGNKVIVVAHSQGNFFANRSWTLLTETEQLSFGMVSVANPDSTVAGNFCSEVAIETPGFTEVLACAASLPTPSFLSCQSGDVRHTTSCSDLVIGGLRFLYSLPDGPYVDVLPRALPPNTTSILTGDWLMHGFVTTYMDMASQTRSKILVDLLEIEAELDAPLQAGDLTIVGRVEDSESGSPLFGSRVKVELIADTLFNAVVDDLTDENGAYALCVPSELIPENFLISASSGGYVPSVINQTKSDSEQINVDFSLVPLTDGVIVIEIDPVLHHLGDDRFSGTINSQFQRIAEGLEYTAVFSLTEAQRNAQAAQLTLFAKGLQYENTISINGELVGFLNNSPSDGSFGLVSIPVSTEVFLSDQELQTLTITSEFAIVDFDDFEFANVLISFVL